MATIVLRIYGVPGYALLFFHCKFVAGRSNKSSLLSCCFDFSVYFWK